MRILLLALVFAPDSVSTAILLTELARQWRHQGDGVVVLTTTPHYNADQDALAEQPLVPRWNGLLWHSECAGIQVFHARVKAKGTRILRRLIDYAGFHVLSTFAGLRYGGGYEVVMASSPPLTIGLGALLLARVRGVPFVYNVQEIYPDIAVSLGILRHRPLIRSIEWLERFIYDRAARVVVISDDFRQRLLAKGVPPPKVCVIPNFVDLNVMQPGERHNTFSKAHQLDGKFVVLYAGNIGLTQDFDTMLGAAQALRDHADVHFLVVGDGALRDWLAGRIAELRLSNVAVLPYQPRSAVPDLYASSDLCLIPLLRGTARHTFPSKIYTIMAAGRPVVVCADADSELSQIVNRARCGFVVGPGEAQGLADAILAARSNREHVKRLAQDGREYVARNHSPEAIAGQYRELFRRVITEARKRW